MNTRYWCAIGWGVVAFTLVLFGLWSFTLMDIFGVLFYSISAYIFTVGAILWRTEPNKKHENKRLNPDDCPIQDLNRGDYE